MALGLAIPFVLMVVLLVQLIRRTRPAPLLRLVVIPSVIVGAFVMRWVVLAAGLPQTLSSPVLQQIVEGIRFVP